MPQQTHLLFDFDGVISDSFALAYDVQRKICPELTADQYRERFEGNINQWEDPANHHTEACRHDRDFFEEYLPRVQNETQPFEEALQVFQELARQHPVGIVTSNLRATVEVFFKKHRVAFASEHILGNDTHTSKVKKIQMWYAEHKARPEEGLFITDTLGDVREAREAGTHPIGVSWGFHEAERLQKADLHALVHTPEELRAAIARHRY